MDTLLTTVQDFCAENSLPVPSAVVGVNDAGVVQFKALMKRLVVDLSQYSWPEQTVRKTFLTLAAEDQGALTSVIGADYNGIVEVSLWNETLFRPLIGPIPAAQWEALHALPVTGPLNNYATFGGKLRLFPAPPANQRIGLMYRSNYGVLASDGVTTKANFTADNDSFLFPDAVVAKGFSYLWKKVKGEEWQADYADYMGLLAKNLVKNTAPTLMLDQASSNIRPGIIVPSGSWGV